MIFLMISLALVTPSTTIFLMISSTFLASTLILAAKSLFSVQTFSERTSVHLKLLANSISFAFTSSMILLASVIFSSTNFLMMASISSTLIFNVLAMVLNSVQTFAERTSSHLTTNSSSLTSSMVGKKCLLISSMISLAFVIPFAMMSFITFMTSANFTWNFAAISRILLHTSAERASSHLKLVAMSMIFWRTNLMISLALVIPLATASRAILSTISTLTFNFLAASFKVAQTFSERISSHVMASSIMSSPDGKKCFLISSMISLALVIPLAMISFITFMTSSNLIFMAAATSLILAH